MYSLNLPAFEYKLKKADGKVWIFDGIRKKYVVLTPEEWVRQHFTNFIITKLGVPRTLIRLEGGLVYNQLKKRSDILVFDRNGNPWMVIECKSPEVKLSASAVQQVAAYNATIKAQYVTVTNGMSHFCAATDWLNKQTTLLDKLPQYETN